MINLNNSCDEECRPQQKKSGLLLVDEKICCENGGLDWQPVAVYDCDSNLLQISWTGELSGIESLQLLVDSGEGFAPVPDFIAEPVSPIIADLSESPIENGSYSVKLLANTGLESEVFSIEVDCNPPFEPTGYLIDDFPGAAVGYSLRKLKESYSGPAIRVRNWWTNAEQDIYFDVDGNLDVAAIYAVVPNLPASMGSVVKWYDQSGNGKDLVQTIALKQPFIVMNGTVVISNGRPSIYFDGNGHFLKQTDSGLPLSGTSVLTVSHYPLDEEYIGDSKSTIFQYGASGFGNKVEASYNGNPLEISGLGFSANGSHYLSASTLGGQNIQLILKRSGVATMVQWAQYINNTKYKSGSPYTETVLTGNPGTFCVGCSNEGGGGLGDFMFGKIQEIVIWNNYKAAQRIDIENNVNYYYETY
jgi:hypothetical protein